MALRGKSKPTQVHYENLANAIIIQAVDDYRHARQQLWDRPNDPLAAQTVQEVERFLLSSYYQCLTKVSGPYILNRLKREDPRYPKRVKRYW